MVDVMTHIGLEGGLSPWPCSTASPERRELEVASRRVFVRVDFNVPLDGKVV
jgi:hypothetical protein